jgi:cation-transporting P-type ATPase 13A2
MKGGEPSIAIAVRTGFSWEKGKMIKSIMFPSPERFNFYFEQNIYLLASIVMVVVCLMTVLYIFIKYYTPFWIVVRFLDNITFAVPPELALVMSMGILFSLGKLKNKNIYWINPTKIRAAGRVSIMVFDKTGTLTESGLNIHSSIIFDGKKFNKKIPVDVPIVSDSQIWLSKEIHQKYKNLNRTKFAEWKASCHSISFFNGDYIGDVLDIEMFKVSKWIMKEEMNSNGQTDSVFFPKSVDEKLRSNGLSTSDAYFIRSIHKFDFSSELQRMSVIVKSTYDEDYTCFVKGSPEIIKTLCREESLPMDYNDMFNKHTAKGRRVIALAYRYCPEFEPKNADLTKREQFEWDLVFLGFLVMVNELKPSTKGWIIALKQGILLITI